LELRWGGRRRSCSAWFPRRTRINPSAHLCAPRLALPTPPLVENTVAAPITAVYGEMLAAATTAAVPPWRMTRRPARQIMAGLLIKDGDPATCPVPDRLFRHLATVCLTKLTSFQRSLREILRTTTRSARTATGLPRIQCPRRFDKAEAAMRRAGEVWPTPTGPRVATTPPQNVGARFLGAGEVVHTTR